MRLTAVDDLHRTIRAVEQLCKTVGVAEQKRCTLIGCEPSGEADRERERIEERASDDVLTRVGRDVCPQSRIDILAEMRREFFADVPDDVIRNGREVLPI